MTHTYSVPSRTNIYIINFITTTRLPPPFPLFLLILFNVIMINKTHKRCVIDSDCEKYKLCTSNSFISSSVYKKKFGIDNEIACEIVKFISYIIYYFRSRLEKKSFKTFKCFGT